MIERLEATLNRYNELTSMLSSPEILGNVDKMTSLSKEQASIAEVVDKYKEYKKVDSDLEEAKELLNDPEMADLAKEDVNNLTSSDIRGLMGSGKPQTAPTTTKPTTMTTNKMQQMFFAFVQPSSGHATKPTVKDATNGAPQTVEGPVTVEVKGANNYDGVNYDVYYVSNAAAAAGELKFNITY